MRELGASGEVLKKHQFSFDSDPRLHLLMRVHQALVEDDEATVSRNVSRFADAVSAPAQHRTDTLTAP
jgi:hypothetical protein